MFSFFLSSPVIFARTLAVNRTSSSFGDRTFAAAGTRVWNSLPPDLRQPGLSYGQFGRSLKKHGELPQSSCNSSQTRGAPDNNGCNVPRELQLSGWRRTQSLTDCTGVSSASFRAMDCMDISWDAGRYVRSSIGNV